MAKSVKLCPSCSSSLHRSMDKCSGIEERICLVCTYYESDSSAYKSYPELFRDAGKYWIARKQKEITVIQKKLSKLGFTKSEGEAWIKHHNNENLIIHQSKVNDEPIKSIRPTHQPKVYRQKIQPKTLQYPK